MFVPPVPKFFMYTSREESGVEETIREPSERNGLAYKEMSKTTDVIDVRSHVYVSVRVCSIASK